MATVRPPSCVCASPAPRPTGGKQRTLSPLASRSTVRSRTTRCRSSCPTCPWPSRWTTPRPAPWVCPPRTGRSRQPPSAVRPPQVPAASTPLTCPRARRCCRSPRRLPSRPGTRPPSPACHIRTRISGLRRRRSTPPPRPWIWPPVSGCSARWSTRLSPVRSSGARSTTPATRWRGPCSRWPPRRSTAVRRR